MPRRSLCLARLKCLLGPTGPATRFMTTILTHRREANRVYSSGGVWRLSQALTHLLDRDLKQVIDERLFGPIGIPPHRWEWTPGRTLFERKDWYADAPGYGDFVDPPYEIGGHVVRGGPGWVVISALDLVRFGHLVATGGVWEGERLMGRSG